MPDRTILVVGTYDTKDDELNYIADVIRRQGGSVLTMDVSVLGNPSAPTDLSKHDVAEAGGHTIREAIEGGDENRAMQIMAKGAALLCARLHGEGRFDAVMVLGGSMGTDLALDVCSALPIGVPKYIVSTVSFSPMIPPDRLPADVQMILWAGGLYGLNSICKASLSQAAGAVLGTSAGMLFLGRYAEKGMMIPVPGATEHPVIPHVDPLYILGVILAALLVSVVSALYPAWRASLLTPVDALRS